MQGVFEDLCEIKTGSYNTQDKIEDGQYPFYVRSSIVERINKYNFEGEAILTAGDGVGVGKVFHYTNGKIGVHQRVYILSNFRCDGKYLYYYFSSRFFDRVKKMSAKNSVDSVRHDMIAKMPITYPTVEEQKKISYLLSLLDKRIELQKSAIEKLKSLKSAINNKLFDTCSNKIKTSIRELGNTFSGLSGKAAGDFGQGEPYITYLNVFQNDIIDTSIFEKVHISDGEKQNKVKYGDALFTLSSETPEEVGYGSIYLGNEEVYLNSFCFGLHINRNDLIFPPYLACLFNTTYFRRFVYPLAQGSTRYNLQKSDFEKKTLLIPSYEDQKRHFLIYESYSKKIQTEIQLLDNYLNLKQFLLNKMFI